MPEAFEGVPDERFVYRFVRKPETFLPKDAVTPIPDWFEPTKSDVEAGKKRDRRPGWSAFDETLTSVEQGRALLGLTNEPAFGLTVKEFRDIAAQFGRSVEAVYLPMLEKKPAAGWDGHVLVEGLKRPDGGDRKQHNDLKLALSQSARPRV